MRHLSDSPLRAGARQGSSRAAGNRSLINIKQSNFIFLDKFQNCTGGGFRVGAGGPAPLFLDQTQARGKKLFGDRFPPSFSKGQDDRPLAYLKVWIRHCVPLLHTNPCNFYCRIRIVVRTLSGAQRWQSETSLKSLQASRSVDNRLPTIPRSIPEVLPVVCCWWQCFSLVNF